MKGFKGLGFREVGFMVLSVADEKHHRALIEGFKVSGFRDLGCGQLPMRSTIVLRLRVEVSDLRI